MMRRNSSSNDADPSLLEVSSYNIKYHTGKKTNLPCLIIGNFVSYTEDEKLKRHAILVDIISEKEPSYLKTPTERYLQDFAQDRFKQTMEGQSEHESRSLHAVYQ